jgi:hypothetical protein
MKFPSKWLEEGIEKPTREAKRKAGEICRYLRENHGLFCPNLMPFREGGKEFPG